MTRAARSLHSFIIGKVKTFVSCVGARPFKFKVYCPSHDMVSFANSEIPASSITLTQALEALSNVMTLMRSLATLANSECLARENQDHKTEDLKATSRHNDSAVFAAQEFGSRN